MFLLVGVCGTATGQDRDAVTRALLPGNARLAASAWPIYHANTRATASSPTLGPGPVDSARTVGALTDRLLRRPSVSPWTVLAEPYPGGGQAALTTPNDGVAKYLIDRDRFEAVDFLRLDRRDLDFDWGILLLRGGLGVVTEQARDRFVVFGDARPGPRSPLEVKRRVAVDRAAHGGLTAHFTLAPDGHLIALTDAGRLIAVDLGRGRVVASLALPAGGASYNSCPIDDRGRVFLATQTGLTAVDWDGRAFRLVWEAAYDMRGPGCEGVPPDRPLREEALAVARGEPCTGTGTTPTILGRPADRGPADRDGVVVIVDGHAPTNNLVAFWQNDPPDDWQALPDPTGRSGRLDRRVAGVLALPLSTPDGDGYTAENSPAAWGNAVVVAQWAGFRPGPDAPRGVQRVDWDPRGRAFELVWANPDVHFNGVPTIARGRAGGCGVYGMGRYGDRYEYVSLDLRTGGVTGRVDLGTDRAVLDQGNNHAVAADGSLIYSGRSRMVRVR